MPSAAVLQTDRGPSLKDLSCSIEEALARIPPLWPLKHFVAANPFLGLVDRPFSEACALLQRVIGAAPLLSPAEYQEAFANGQISPADLAAVSDARWTPEALLEGLDVSREAEPLGSITTVAELLDQRDPHARWSEFVTEEISKWCGVTFDENQATWSSPWKNREGFYAAWREGAMHDRNPEAFGLPDFRRFVMGLPADASAAIADCIGRLDPQFGSLADFLHRQLASISGWAGYAQYRVREDAMRGRQNSLLKELLAVRLAYDTALYHAFARDGALRADWRHQKTGDGGGDYFEMLARWQLAYERGFQRRLARALTAQRSSVRLGRPAAQAVFCIDVRSEVFRRHLETALPGLQTLGFAGFFGFPIAHETAGASVTARCPALLVPPVTTCEPLSRAEAAAAATSRAEAGAWKAFQNSAASCFSFVETVGLAFGAALCRPAPRPSCVRAAPDFATLSLAARVDLAASALRNMSLTRNFARLVLLCGHGSESVNNPYASGLDCGACGGHAGDVNARLAVATLNNPDVRVRLAAQGIVIPEDTWFVAGLHNTTTDDVTLFDLQGVPCTHSADLPALRHALAVAGTATRRERAPRLGLVGLPDEKIDAAVRSRAGDIAQVRPEWGLANNAAFIAAPRARTEGLNLEGRVFLHDYDCDVDPDSKVLTLILSAPVVVASWINLHYYASRVDPVRYGAGNKVLHNIVGGLGAMEGNGGDLKVGLPLQSIHDGKNFVHEPRRLSVFVEAPREKIGEVLRHNPSVRQLFEHGWIHLFSLEDTSCHTYREGAWQLVDTREYPSTTGE